MVKISGTLSSNVSLSGRAAGGHTQPNMDRVEAVKEASKPSLQKEQRPDMTFNGIGRQIDIRV
ncbi:MULTISPECIES: hypothetical protein [Sneathiella]|jgi:hypothetical protein|uniref:hypothetical protein n=1 Tax=Sneathiella TaxID=510690 RepID=UPI00146F0B90|nr:hypothetical protein [Sneathiella aquimaris]